MLTQIAQKIACIKSFIFSISLYMYILSLLLVRAVEQLFKKLEWLIYKHEFLYVVGETAKPQKVKKEVYHHC